MALHMPQMCQAALPQCREEFQLVAALAQLSAQERPQNTTWTVLKARTGLAAAREPVASVDSKSFAQVLTWIQQGRDIGYEQQQLPLTQRQRISEALHLFDQAQRALRKLYHKLRQIPDGTAGGAWYSMNLLLNAVLQALPEQYQPKRGDPKFQLQFCGLCQQWAEDPSGIMLATDHTIKLAQSHLLCKAALFAHPSYKAANAANAPHPQRRVAYSTATRNNINLDSGYAKMFCHPGCEVERFGVGENAVPEVLREAENAALGGGESTLGGPCFYHFGATTMLRTAYVALPLQAPEELLLLLRLSGWVLSYAREDPSPEPLPLSLLTPACSASGSWEPQLSNPCMRAAVVIPQSEVMV